MKRRDFMKMIGVVIVAPFSLKAETKESPSPSISYPGSLTPKSSISNGGGSSSPSSSISSSSKCCCKLRRSGDGTFEKVGCKDHANFKDEKERWMYEGWELRDDDCRQLYQLHHLPLTTKTHVVREFVSQRIPFNPEEFQEWFEETAKDFPLPDGYAWLLVNDKSYRFMRMTDSEIKHMDGWNFSSEEGMSYGMESNRIEGNTKADCV